MDVAIAGAHGKVGRRLARLLVARGDRVRGLIRNPDHAEDLRADGSEPVVCDLERSDVDEIAKAIEGADAVVFAAGAGPGSGAERKRTVDLGAAVKLLDAARRTGARRYLMISAMGAGDPAAGAEAMRPYLEAKAQADAALAASELDWTIVRPGGLTDEPGTGRVEVAASLGRRGTVTRDDVAAVLVACLDEPRTVRATFDLLQGETPIAQALAAL